MSLTRIISVASLACLLATAAELPQIDIPAWVDQEIKATSERLNAWKGQDQTVVFPILTDVHTGGRDTYRHIAYVNHAAKTFNFDFIADLGDIGLDIPATKDPEKAREILDRHAALHRQFPGIAVTLVGNHDHNRVAGKDNMFTDQQLGDAFMAHNLKRSPNFVLSSNPTIGYYDIPAAKLRVFFLNTNDIYDTPGKYYTMSEKQLQFIADHLKTNEDGWLAVTLTHFCVRPMGNWLDYNDSCFNSDIYLKILTDCNAGQAGTMKSVKWDFSKGPHCRVMANLIGDSHFDNQEIYEGIYFNITQGYGGVAAASMPKGSLKTPFNPGSMMLVDIAAIKPAKGELRLFRLGAGGAARDRSFTLSH